MPDIGLPMDVMHKYDFGKDMDITVLDGWNGPQPVFDPVAGAYICGAGDGERLESMIKSGLLPAPGKIPGDSHLSLREMVMFQFRKDWEKVRRNA